MNLSTHPARVVAAVAAVIAAGTTTVLALTAGTAVADEAGRCTQNVNVREKPEATSRIVALCEAGTEVMLGAERDDFVYLDKLHGWASKEFVTADGAAAGTGGSDAASEDADADSADADGTDADGPDADSTDADGAEAGSEDAGTGGGDRTGDAAGSAQSGDEGAQRDGAGDADGAQSADAKPAAAPAPRRVGGLAGLLG
jgi:hypothetical protein